MVKKELAEKLSVFVNLHKQTKCDSKNPLAIQQLDKDIRININWKNQKLCPRSLSDGRVEAFGVPSNQESGPHNH